LNQQDSKKHAGDHIPIMSGPSESFPKIG
jgi:hypothetical protein